MRQLAKIPLCLRIAGLALALSMSRGAGLGPARAAETIPAQAASKDSTNSTARSLWTRMVMIGASVSAGFTLSEPLGGSNTPQYRLSRYIDAAVSAPHEPIQNLSSAWFFINPEIAGKRQIQQALALQPTLILAVDFPFWLCYGDQVPDDQRMRRFEYGLQLLESIDGPLVVGDIPDASAAAAEILSEAQIPSGKVLAAANQRLREWAASRPRVIVVPLASVMRSAMSNETVTIPEHTWPAGKTRGFLQNDHLHPSAKGCAALALVIADAVIAVNKTLSRSEVHWDPEEVLRLGLGSLKPAPSGTPEKH